MYTRDDLPNYLSRHVYDTLAPIFAVKDNRMRHYLGVPLREEEDMPKLGERALRRALRGTREPACLWANYSPNMLSRLYQDMPRDVKNALKVVCGHHYTAAEYLRSLRSMGATVRSAGRTARLVRSHAQRGRILNALDQRLVADRCAQMIPSWNFPVYGWGTIAARLENAEQTNDVRGCLCALRAHGVLTYEGAVDELHKYLNTRELTKETLHAVSVIDQKRKP